MEKGLRITDRQRLVLSLVQHCAETPLNILAKHGKLKEHTLRYEIQRLRERGILLSKVPFINIHRLGYFDFNVYFTLAPRKVAVRQRVIEYLLAQPEVIWLARLGGEFEFGLALSLHSVWELSDFLERISKKAGDLFLSKSLSLRTEFTAFGRRYLGPNVPIPVLHSKSHKKRIEIDATDRALLRSLTTGTWTSLAHAAKAAGMSHVTFGRRLKKLEDDEVISGFIYRLALPKLMVQHYRLLITARSSAGETAEKIYRLCEQTPAITHYITAFGEWDFELAAEVYQPEDVLALVRTLYDELGEHVIEIKLLQVFGHMKYSPFPG